ncbi:hypothetical protein Lser_V15G25568 [Lactuca serriola]
MANLKFSDTHNLAVFLVDSPAPHSDFKSMINGLKECCLTFALTASPVIYQEPVKQFWKTATVFKENGEDVSVVATIYNRKVLITEQVIREVL